jgi:hypothetical protein
MATAGEFTVTDPANNCVHEDPGAPFTKDHFSQFTFTGGATLTGDIGIDLSARTGWSTNGSLTMKAPSTTGLRLCGLAGAPASNSAKKLEFVPAWSSMSSLRMLAVAAGAILAATASSCSSGPPPFGHPTSPGLQCIPLAGAKVVTDGMEAV